MGASILKPAEAAADTRLMPVMPGNKVEVCSRFRRVWVSGFEVVDIEGDAYRLRRLSDQWVLPTLFPSADVRPVRVMVPGRVVVDRRTPRVR
jgi:hypothetical protein